MVVKNTSERRLSMGQFAGLFLAALALACFAFTHSSNLHEKFPAEELAMLREKQKMVESLVDLSKSLRQFETEQLIGALTAADRDAEVYEKIVVMRRHLLNKDTLTQYSDIKKLMDMAEQYRYFIKKTSKEGDQKIQVLNQQIAELQQQLQVGELDKKSAQIDAQTKALQVAQAAKTAAAGGGGGGGAAMPAPLPGQAVVIPPTNTGNANCDLQVNQVKSQYQRACTAMQTPFNQIRTDVSSISKGLFSKNKSEKDRIEQNLQKIERQLEALNN